MADFEIKINKADEVRLRRLFLGGQRRLIVAEILTLFEQLGIRAGSFVAGNMRRKKLIDAKSRQLERSIIGKGELINGLPAVRVGVFRGSQSLAYAGVQEHGTKGKNPQSPYPTIKPKNAKYLWMPVGTSLTPAGLSRYKSVSSDPRDLVIIPTSGKNPNVAYRVFDEDTIEAVEDGQLPLRNAKAAYLLLRKVDIKPHYFLRKGMQAFLPKITSALAKTLRRITLGQRGPT